ncbi:MAG: hypothetical protein ACI9Y1_002810 [Lentisphaeria bacterium]|jgi:uncharacterized protein YehS (DUF1456 family)
MTNNDIIRRLRYIFDYSDPAMMHIFALADYPRSHEQIRAWMVREGEVDFVVYEEMQLASFLNGLIIKNRGMKVDRASLAEKKLTNNMVLMKLKIAMDIRTDEFLDVMKLAGSHVSKHEVSALFRKPSYKHYRVRLDQFLRNFFARPLPKIPRGGGVVHTV